MLWSVCLAISIWMAIVPPIIAITIEANKSRGIHAPVFRVGVVSILISAAVGFFPLMSGAESGTFAETAKAVLLAALHAMKAFAMGVEFGELASGIERCSADLATGYLLWAAVLVVLAPMFTFGFVLSLFRNLSARIQYALANGREMYVFSELTDQSMILAADLKRNHPKAALAFAETTEKESSEELVRKANDLGAILFRGDIASIARLRHSEKKGLWLFAMGEDEDKNLDLALQLIDICRERPNTNLYVSSLSAESELLLTAVEKGKVRLRRINEVRSMINRVLYQDGHRLFDNALPAEDGVKEIHGVIVGMGHHGTEMLKALAWYGQMDGYRVHIHAFEKDRLAEEKITADAPELLSPAYNGVMIEGEAQYRITVHSGCDVDTVAFARKISEISRATYVLVSLGDDDLNTRTAVRLRMLFERIGVHPIIQAILYNSRRKEALTGITNYRGQPYDIEFVGDMESSYTEAVIIDSALEQEALQRHLKWGKAEEFWNYEYNYRSSVAAALHKHARIHCGILGAELPEEQMEGEALRRFEMLEHRRWNAYMRAEGYVYSGSPHQSSRNDLAKMHHNLVVFDELSEKDKRKDSRVGLK